jgi:probable HAF family extracellular repeat protein
LGTGISADGRVIVGASTVLGIGTEAFRWTETEGMVGIGDLEGGSVYSVATDASADGSVIVGQSLSTGGWEAFRWTESEGMVGLGFIEQNYSYPWAVSGNGRVIVGEARDDGKTRAFVWTQRDGMRNLQRLIVDELGLDIGNMEKLTYARGVSADGSTIVGTGFTRDGQVGAWLVYLGPQCRVDFDQNGEVTAQDVLQFLQTWSDGGLMADWDYNGTVDTRDVIMFLREWVPACP